MPTTVSAPETLSETRTQTRELLLQTALSMLEQGWFPSITELANASGVSRATAYRYFPSQAALVSTVVDESLGPVLQWQPTSTSVEARVNELLDFAYPRMEQHEGALRAALQVALHQWANERARRAQDEPKYRRGNRRRLLMLAVEPMVQAGVDPAVAARLAQSLSLLYGTEAMVVLKDIWGLDFREFMSVIKWMSSALVQAALAEAGGAAGAGSDAAASGHGAAQGASSAEGVAGADRLEGSERERSAQAAHDAGAAADAAPDGGRAAIVQGGGGGAGSADQASGAAGERAADRPPAALASDGDERDA
ncbi:TetR/AcrR family transcriptional regulator [Burkholderia thailandensis]|uniref:TetR/AcrR family transcriptional regulator n=2 Tax=Burkholderia thailandensis TaxID=57975 RepID=UPI00031FD283|nr:TetR/AcrR family transcriptional regulator [Burkholderia thailandensis]AHI74904.1 helix-turn-helix domain of resolvase family protein [Burkholderia thailandensis 2002721723]AHI82430.1 helix-turn-helix domain of resolvase family protein [Burkholderia thailandensis E444]AIP29193.1 helix-turn-helix domain of resolvase family protein [Burkholderia thailandensis E264]AIS99176.1 helix-turn-helix domain of resolvase family protein [Burkholderia thailandensis MSMB59]AIT23477.1 helix-turn-helix doma